MPHWNRATVAVGVTLLSAACTHTDIPADDSAVVTDVQSAYLTMDTPTGKTIVDLSSKPELIDMIAGVPANINVDETGRRGQISLSGTTATVDVVCPENSFPAYTSRRATQTSAFDLTFTKTMLQSTLAQALGSASDAEMMMDMDQVGVLTPPAADAGGGDASSDAATDPTAGKTDDTQSAAASGSLSVGYVSVNHGGVTKGNPAEPVVDEEPLPTEPRTFTASTSSATGLGNKSGAVAPSQHQVSSASVVEAVAKSLDIFGISGLPDQAIKCVGDPRLISYAGHAVVPMGSLPVPNAVWSDDAAPAGGTAHSEGGNSGGQSGSATNSEIGGAVIGAVPIDDRQRIDEVPRP